MKLKRKLYAARDYWYLSQPEADAYRKERSQLAKKLLEKRNQINKDIASYNTVSGADIAHNEKIRSANYKYALKETKAEAEKLRNKALDNETSTLIGKETNTYAKMNLPKKESTAPKTTTINTKGGNKRNTAPKTKIKNIVPKNQKPNTGNFISNTWNNMGTLGKGATIGAATLATGLAVKGILGSKSKKKEEKE